MFCNKCGSIINDGDEFCPKCGNKINREKSIAGQTQEMKFTVRDLLIKKKIVIPALILLVVSIVIGAFFVLGRSPKIEGRFYSYCYYDDGYFDFTSDSSLSNGGTYKYLLSEILNSTETGVWVLKNDELIISDSYHDNEVLKRYKNYIYYVDYTYKCNVPNGKTFDLTCELGKSTYLFNKNGTFTYTYENDVTSGTYERTGDTISVKLNKPTKKKDYRLLILEDGINNSAYYKK